MSRKRSQTTLKLAVIHTTTWWDVFLYFYNNWHEKEDIYLDNIDGPTCLCRGNYKSDYFYIDIAGNSQTIHQLVKQGIQLRNKWKCKIEIMHDWPSNTNDSFDTNKLYVDHLPETLKYDVEHDMLRRLFMQYGQCQCKLYKTKGKEHYAMIIYDNDNGIEQVNNVLTTSVCGVLKLPNKHLIRVHKCNDSFMPNVRGVFESAIEKKNSYEKTCCYQNEIIYLKQQLQMERMKQHETKQVNRTFCMPTIKNEQTTCNRMHSISLSTTESPQVSPTPPPAQIAPPQIKPINWEQIVTS